MSALTGTTHALSLPEILNLVLGWIYADDMYHATVRRHGADAADWFSVPLAPDSTDEEDEEDWEILYFSNAHVLVRCALVNHAWFYEAVPYLWRDPCTYMSDSLHSHFSGISSLERKQFYANFVRVGKETTSDGAGKSRLNAQELLLEGPDFPRLEEMSIYLDGSGAWIPPIRGDNVRVLTLDPSFDVNPDTYRVSRADMDGILDILPIFFPNAQTVEFLDSCLAFPGALERFQARMPRLETFDHTLDASTGCSHWELMDVDQDRITRVPSPAPPTLPPPPLSYDEHRSNQTPLVIDNGSTYLRYGFATSENPRSGLNVVAKYKERRTNKPLLLFGDGVEVEGGAKIQARTPWEGDVLLNSEALENALDYAFVQLSIDAETVEHPMIMTERLCSPMHSRAITSELLFEQYGVPSVAYCVDSIMSFYQNNGPSADGLVLSFNTASTSVIPILSGKGILSHAKRIPWGASQSADYLLKLVQLKYPNFPTRVTPPQSQWMLQNMCEFAPDYLSLLRSFKYCDVLRAHDRIVQFPFAQLVQEEKSPEELERAAERRREQGRKLQEMAAKMRTEKLEQKETDLQFLHTLRDGKDGESKRDWMASCLRLPCPCPTIKKLESDLKKARRKDAVEDDEEPNFPLVDVPDAELDEEGLREKKKQKLMKAGFEARARARKEKERERAEQEEAERREEQEREQDLGGWIRKMRQEQEALMARIKERNRRKAALSDRKSAAAQARMKNIASLAADERAPKKKRKGGGEDNFGANDADWAIYRKINIAAPSDDEEEDLNQLQTIEGKLLSYDPTFTILETHASLVLKRSELLTTLRPVYDENDIEGSYRVHLNTERWRVCETYFAPGMAGVDSAGLGEVIQNVLARFTSSEKEKLVQNVFLTGAPTQFPGLSERLQLTMRPILAPEMQINICKAEDVSADAWRGMARFAKSDEFAGVGVTRAEYDEYGGERTRRWWGGNWN
ncbi:unnamed protein product [Mycena citricolor]|uniref:Actin-like ATPase domain-containing protein n=1 Tax=Mycena citricolor TaxID=2018698 RepID=A0AAD2HPW1_9AGAR|nr:unnamed protein product [Mycena citricolor]